MGRLEQAVQAFFSSPSEGSRERAVDAVPLAAHLGRHREVRGQLAGWVVKALRAQRTAGDEGAQRMMQGLVDTARETLGTVERPPLKRSGARRGVPFTPRRLALATGSDLVIHAIGVRQNDSCPQCQRLRGLTPRVSATIPSSVRGCASRPTPGPTTRWGGIQAHAPPS